MQAIAHQVAGIDGDGVLGGESQITLWFVDQFVIAHDATQPGFVGHILAIDGHDHGCPIDAEQIVAHVGHHRRLHVDVGGVGQRLLAADVGRGVIVDRAGIAQHEHRPRVFDELAKAAGI